MDIPKRSEEIFLQHSFNKGMDYLLKVVPLAVKINVSICIDREKGQSYRCLSRRYKLSHETIRKRCKKCTDLLG